MIVTVRTKIQEAIIRFYNKTFVIGAQIRPSFSLGEPMTNAQYLWSIASQVSFQSLKVEKTKE